MANPRFFALTLALCLMITGPVWSQNLKPYLQCATDHSIWVNWRTTSGTESTVYWGASADALTNTVTGSYHTFAANYLWHGAKIAGLQPNSVYYYKVKTGAEESAVFRFRTYQNPAGANGHIRVLIVGDTQHPTTAQRTFAAAKEKLIEKYGPNLEDQVQLILKQGDNVDAGVLSQYISMHFDPLSNLSGNIPTMTVLGNHEYYQNSDLSYYFPHFEFDDPDIQYNGLAGQNGEHYYAFRAGSVLFCMMNSNEWWASQTNWLNQVVTTADADPTVRWIFGTAHHPLRCENWVSDGSAYIRDQIMPVLRSSEKAAMYTSGHSHMYARGSSRDSAVWEVISGGGGLIQNWNENVEQDYPDVQRSFDVWTYQIMDIDLDAGTMDIECYSIGNEEYVLDNELIDSFHRYFGKPKPARPALLAMPGDTVALPFTFEGSAYASPSGELHNSTEFEVAGASGDFELDLILNVKRDFENYYQIESAAYWSPIDQAASTNIFQLTVDSTQVFQGQNWIRVRHRDRNLEWSDWSEPLPFIAENGKMPLALEPIAWWHFNSDAVDATGHGFNGVVPATGVTFVQDAPIRGQVAQFNNTQSIAVRTGPTASAGLPVVQMTVSGWVQVHVADTWGGFIGCIQDNGNYEKGWVLGTRDKKFSYALMTEGGSTQTYLTDTEDFALDQWYYVTATYNGAMMKLYVNGVLKSSSTAQNGDIVYAGLTTDWFGIGSYVDENENWLHDGALDELILWERALSDAEVASLYTGVSNLAPEVTITSPTQNATYFAPATISVSADATDMDNNVSLVEFYNGTQKIYEDTDGAPFGFLWENVPAGVHSITAKATDNLGAKTTSLPVEVIVLVDMSPMITCPPDVTVESAPASCQGTHSYTVDFSNGDLSQTSGLPSGDFPPGVTINQFVVTDTSGNTASCSFSVTVLDNTPPAIACIGHTIVKIGLDDPSDCYGSSGNGGVAWQPAAAFDNGTVDNCSGMLLTIRRAAPYSNCIQILNTVNGHPDCNDPFPDFPSEFERAISEQDSIKFYCCEAGTTQTVLLRAYQLNANGSISTDANNIPVYSECSIQVDVVDDIKPVCMPPANVTVACDNFDPTLTAYGAPGADDNCCIAGVTTTLNVSQFDSLCYRGTIVRSFKVSDCSSNTGTCTQRIVVDYTQDYYIRFPDDVFQTICIPGQSFGAPTFSAGGCALLGISYEDEIIDVVPDACFRIERNWTVINWCTFNPAALLINIPNPNPSAISNHPTNLPGPVVSACGTLPPWESTTVKIFPFDTAATNYCTFWNAHANGYKYHQTIKVIDYEDPEIVQCQTTPSSIADTTLNDPALWNEVFNPALPAQDLTETPVDLSITSTDNCYGGNLNVEFLLYMDLDQDGIFESVLPSTSLPAGDTIRYNNLNTPGFSGGIPLAFDARPVPENQKWHFTLQSVNSATELTSAVRWNTAQDPGVFVTPQLPEGLTKIKWFVMDQCGNEVICEEVFTIQPGITSVVSTLENDGFALYQNEPNPFSQRTSIGFRLPESAEAVLSVYNTEGRPLWIQKGDFGSGYQSIKLEGDWLRSPGVLYYKLECGARVAWRKMVLIR